MERYKVSISSPETGSNLRLLIPFPATSSLSALATEVKRRAAKQGLFIRDRTIFFRLNQDDGPILDDDDKLGEVIIDPHNEDIFATFLSIVSLMKA